MAEGEVTGHKHQLISDNDFYFAEEDNGYMVKLIETTPLKHEEHKTIVLEPGQYQFSRQREYDPIQYQRSVAD